MDAFLYGLAGAIVGVLLLIVGGYFLIKFILRRLVKKFIDALGQGGVPPFRIHLSETDDLEWKDSKLVEALTEQLESVGYETVGDYEIDEMFNVQIRGLANPAHNFYAVIYEYEQLGVVVDIACDLVDLTHVTSTTAKETGLNNPETKRDFRHELDLQKEPSLVLQLHERLVEETRGHSVVSAPADQFVARITDAYAREMDWRAERGGISVEEVKRMAELGGQEEPDDEAIQQVQFQWRLAISQFMDEKIRERFLRHVTKMSASEWEDVRDRLYIVHEQSFRESVVEQVKWCEANVDEDDDAELEEIEERLKKHFEYKPIREAFAEAQTNLAESRRYRRLARITGPWPADVYLMPEEEDEDED